MNYNRLLSITKKKKGTDSIEFCPYFPDETAINAKENDNQMWFAKCKSSVTEISWRKYTESWKNIHSSIADAVLAADSIKSMIVVKS